MMQAPAPFGTRVLGPDSGRDRGAFLPARLRLDGVVDDAAEIDDGDLQDHHQEDELPDRIRAVHRKESTPGLEAFTLWGWEGYEPGSAEGPARARGGTGLRQLVGVQRRRRRPRA